MFLKERDRIIAAQAEQIRLLTAEVAKLMTGIDRVEVQVDVMQAQVSDKDVAFTTKKMEAEELRVEANRLQALLKEVSAREYAMDSATKQNAELLKLLQQSEKNNLEVSLMRRR